MAARDLKKEQYALKTFGSAYKKMPSTPDDWAKLHRIAYGDDIPDELKSVVANTIPSAGMTQPAVSGNTLPNIPKPISQNPVINNSAIGGQLQNAIQTRDAAQKEYSDMNKPYQVFRTFEQALQKKVGSSNMEIGPADIYGTTGVGGYGALQASLAARKAQINEDQQRMTSYASDIGAAYKETYDSANERFKAASTAYNNALDGVAAYEREIYQAKSAIEATTKAQQAQRELELFKDQLNNNAIDLQTGRVIDTSKIIGGYDFQNYATDQNWGKAVNVVLNQIGKLDSLQGVDAYIKNKYPNSPLTGDMISKASQQFGVSWEMLLALADHESNLATSNVALKNNNLGGITWNGSNGIKGTARPAAEGGNYVKFPTLQDGLNTMARNIAGRKTNTSTNTSNNVTIDGYDISRFSPAFYKTKDGQLVVNNEQQSYSKFIDQKVVKDYQDIQTRLVTINKVLDSGVGGPGDLVIVYDFMKALDEDSVVREKEYELAAESGNIFLGKFAKYNGYLKSKGGFLPKEVKESFVAITNSKMEANYRTYELFRAETRRIAASQGLNPDNIAPNLSLNLSLGKNNTQPTTMQVNGVLYTLQPNGKYRKQ